MPVQKKVRTRITRPGRETPALVGIVTRLKDWRLLETQRWYRIPVRSAPEGLDSLRYLAFYQTRAFGIEKYSVICYAEVLGIRNCTRRELLPDEPDHRRADERYYRLELGPLQRLPRPIPSRRWRRIVFIPTSLERLLAAQEINDLFLTSPIEDRLYSALREAGLSAERQYLVRESGTGHLLDLALFCRDGMLNIECDGARWHDTPQARMRDRSRDNELTADGWRILRFSGSEINRTPQNCLRTVRRAVRRLGGLERRNGTRPGP
jgi:very-short-patch-repair endonuclease